MSNPFKEADKKPKVAPPAGHKDVPVVKTESPVVEPEPEVSEEPMIGKEFLKKFVEQKSDGKSYSFYLSSEAGQKLEKLAKQLKCSKSKALDILLKNAVE